MSFVARMHHLLLTTKLSAQKVFLSSIDNTKKPIRIICDELARDMMFYSNSAGKHKLVVTGEDPFPIEINTHSTTRYDLETSHEKADIIIVPQVLTRESEVCRLSVVSEDTVCLSS